MTADQMKKIEKLLNEIFTLNKNVEGFAKKNNILDQSKLCSSDNLNLLKFFFF